MAVNNSDIAVAVSPYNVSFWKNRTRVFNYLSSVDEKYLTDSLGAITIAHKLAPTDAKISYNLALLLAKSGKKDEAVSFLKETLLLKPDYSEAREALLILQK